ncbi:MAG: low molecular weight phosphotyrosine protein phosphatase [Rhodobacteraceae bacterium]|nr:low molecular weight phosphotyrosine protein phosphatase [Paracoccaceae bacterium]
MNRLLTVCTGNICRSPLAEAALRRACPGRTVSSAGLHALVGHGIDPDSAAAAATLGLPLSAHSARQLTEEIAREADLILVMQTHHRDEIMHLWPHFTGKTFLLGQFEAAKEIPDPYRRGAALHLRAAEMVVQSAALWAQKLERL